LEIDAGRYFTEDVAEFLGSAVASILHHLLLSQNLVLI